MSKIEPHSGTWAAVSALCAGEIIAAQARLERPGLSPIETEFQRGMLKALRKVLALADPVEVPAVNPPTKPSSSAGY